MDDLPDEDSGTPTSSPTGPPCRHLRSKGMYVYTDATAAEEDLDYDNTIFWCQKTSKSFGPDHALVGRHDCVDTSRRCYEPD